jgi:hypothetical protein
MGLPFFFLINLLVIAISIYLLGKRGKVGDYLPPGRVPKPRQGRPLDPFPHLVS